MYYNGIKNLLMRRLIIMTDKEKKYLDYIDESVFHCLKRGIDKMQIAEWLDDEI